MESVDGVNWENNWGNHDCGQKESDVEKAMRDDEERKKRETTNTWNIGKSYYYSMGKTMENPWEFYGKSMGNRSSPGQGMKKARQFLALEPLDDEVNQCQAEEETTGFTQDLPWKNVAKTLEKTMESAKKPWLQRVSNFQKYLNGLTSDIQDILNI